MKIPDTVQRVSFHRKGGAGVIVHALFFVLYAAALQRCYNTVGEPYQLALAEQARLKQEKLLTDPSLGLSNVTNSEAPSSLGDATDVGHSDPEISLGDLSLAEFAEEDELSVDVVDVEDKESTLPSPLLPGFWPCFFLAATIAAHVLFMFMSVWSVRWKVFMHFMPSKVPYAGGFAYVTPLRHQGKDDIVPVTRSPVSGCLVFTFHRHKYICKVPGELFNNEPYQGDEVSVEHLDCPDNLPLVHYLKEASGLDANEVKSAVDKFGVNSFEIPCPTFMELYKKQLMSPVAVFQIFCMVLWMLDEYWKYTAFTLVMILAFEGSTAMTRLRNLKTIRGMGNKPSTLLVYRSKSWQQVTSDQLLPGDLISLRHVQGESNVVPCDCLILSGNAVVNESTLTGESIPQMKGALHDVEDRKLDIENRDKIHTLFSGTTLMQHSVGNGPVPTTDDGLLCYVLRTGFRSSQGTLMRMVEFSTEQVSADKKETAMLLCLLFCFACASSGYVLYQGLKDESRSKYQLLLRCVLILTSVVPPELPMQMGLAVNTALMALHKSNIFCTEPFRIPMGGKVSHCLFDKTGTLTTDQLVAVGVVDGKKAGSGPGAKNLAPMTDASDELNSVVGGCHSLIQVQETLMGDPIELAALGAIKWRYTPSSQKAFPAPPPQEGTANGGGSSAPQSKPRAGKLAVEIAERHHFSSALQRMSVVANVVTSSGDHEVWTLVKGSPEAIVALLAPGSKPEWYDSTYQMLAERGMRILAMAYKKVPKSEAANVREAASKPRDWAESQLHFAGFVAFSCLARKDTEAVVGALGQAAMYQAMITGDAPLTALQVAAEVGITSGKKELALLLKKGADGKLVWASAYAAHTVELSFSAATVVELAQTYDLSVSGASLAAAVAQDPAFWTHMECIKVFARMSPDGKADVIKALKERGFTTLMCGDGGNDVGALKQADVGLALLSGFGNMNAESSSELHGDGNEKAKDERSPLEKLKANQMEMAAKAAVHKKRMTEGMAKKKKELMAQQQERLEAEFARRKEAGQTGMMAQMGGIKAVMTQINKELREYQVELMKNAPKRPNPLEGLAAIEESTDMMPIVKLGDASIAAPFTSKMPSISSILDIIRQGRCTLVNTVQQQQIMMLNCMISAFCLAVMHMQGSRSSEEQLISTGMFLTVASFAFSFATPIEKLANVRPLTSVFHPALFISVMGQLAIHLSCIVWVVSQAKVLMGEEQLQEAIRMAKILEKADMSGEYPEELKVGEGDEGPVHKKHYPNLLNTCVFLVETSQQVSVMAVNYKGRPFMLGTTENAALLWSLALCAIGLFVAVNEVVPELNTYLGLVPFPNEDIRRGVVVCVAVSMFGSFIWDRICLFFFARHIFMASLQEAKETKLSDYYPQLKKVGIALAVLAWLGLFQGNVLVLGAVWYFYRQRQKMLQQQKEAEQARLAASSSN